MANIMTPEDKRQMYDHIYGAHESISNEDIVGQTIGMFIQKSRGYSGSSVNFGVKGEMIEISRKYWRLFGILEEGQPEAMGEGVEELCMDMVGHLLMMIYHKRKDDPEVRLYRPFGEGEPFAKCTCGGTGNSCRVHPLGRGDA